MSSQEPTGSPVSGLEGVVMTAPVPAGGEGILTRNALAFVVELERRFRDRRWELLEARSRRRERLASGVPMDFLTETAAVRRDDWVVAPIPDDLQDRRVEITGPVDRKMMINALNSGAQVFMADFEDASTPTWENLVLGQQNAVDAHRGTLSLVTDEKEYRLGDDPATLLVRPRGWHLPEKHLLVDGAPMSGSLFDFGLYLFHGGRAALEAGSGPYFYIPKLESHLEARLWNDVFVHAQQVLGIPVGTIKATVLIETIWAAFEMDEILYELRDHAAGLNAGRWDYIFSVIKAFRHDPEHVLPDRSQVTMTVPFMRAYTDLQVATCHRRRAHAIGGMAAFIPNRRDEAVTARALEAVRADKRREAQQGCDGTWVAHPDLVALAREEFDAVLDGRPNQVERVPDASVSAADLTDVTIEGGTVTEDGVRANVSVGIRYLAWWLAGQGAVALDNLMEDAATAEISRSQLWQWIHHGVKTTDGREVTAAMVSSIADEVLEDLADLDTAAQARAVFESVAIGETFVDFLTLPAYELID